MPRFDNAVSHTKRPRGARTESGEYHGGFGEDGDRPAQNDCPDAVSIGEMRRAVASLRDDLQSKLGTFPLFDFWGPRTSIKSSQWIADAAIHVDRQHNQTLTLVYLPHLDYSFQRVGPRVLRWQPTCVKSTPGAFGGDSAFSSCAAYGSRGCRSTG